MSDTKQSHHPSCEIVGYGICTCDFWQSRDVRAFVESLKLPEPRYYWPEQLRAFAVQAIEQYLEAMKR